MRWQQGTRQFEGKKPDNATFSPWQLINIAEAKMGKVSRPQILSTLNWQKGNFDKRMSSWVHVTLAFALSEERKAT